MRRYGLRDDQWDRIKDFLPGREGHVGGTADDNRLFVEAVLYRFRTGCPWRDLPERFGHWKAVHQRFGRWAKSEDFERIFKLLASDHDNEYMIIENPALCPSTETLMNRFPMAETLRQITPGTPGSKSVENGLDEQSIIVRRAAYMSLTPGQKILDPIPLIVA